MRFVMAHVALLCCALAMLVEARGPLERRTEPAAAGSRILRMKRTVGDIHDQRDTRDRAISAGPSFATKVRRTRGYPATVEGAKERAAHRRQAEQTKTRNQPGMSQSGQKSMPNQPDLSQFEQKKMPNHPGMSHFEQKKMPNQPDMSHFGQKKMPNQPDLSEFGKNGPLSSVIGRLTDQQFLSAPGDYHQARPAGPPGMGAIGNDVTKHGEKLLDRMVELSALNTPMRKGKDYKKRLVPQKLW